MNENKTDFIYGVKVILCCMVAFGHFYNFIGGRYIYGIRLIGGMGARAVDVFFFLTAFLTMLSHRIKRKTGKEFFKGRLKRLYPEYLPVICIAIITLKTRSIFQKETLEYLTGNNIGAWGVEYNVRGIPDIKSIILHLIFCNGIVPCGEVLGVTWSLPIEVWFYIIFMLIINCAGEDIKREQLITKILYVLSIIAGVVLFFNGMTDHQHSFIRSLPIMFMGVIFADVYFGFMKKGIGLIFASVGLGYLFFINIGQNWLSVAIISFVMVSLLFDGAAVSTIKRFLSNGFFKKSCRLSYSIYLIHSIVIAFIFGGMIIFNGKIIMLTKEATVFLALILSVVITVVWSIINYRFAGCVLKVMDKRE